MATPPLAEQMREYEAKWVAIVEKPEQTIVGSGAEPRDAQLEAQRRGYDEPVLLWVPPIGDLFAP
ncbi:MAG TPA: hypothetical protein VKJ45_29980 [Blastocatellia bacterium]|nr:hypothetical protein [Blastocatellia bacterium]